MSLSQFSIAHMMEASEAMVSALTEAEVRRQAGQYLEQAMFSPNAWELFADWLGESARQLEWRYQTHRQDDEASLGSFLLLLQMLQRKIRRQLSHDFRNPPALAYVRLIHQQLLDLSSKHHLDTELRSSTCSTLAAIVVRAGEPMLRETHQEACCGTSMSPIAALQFLANVPLEAESSNITVPQVMEVLGPYLKIVLETTGQLIAHNHTVLLPATLKTVRNWIKVCHVTISQLLQTPIHQVSLLQLLIQLLSQSECEDETILTNASQALAESARQSLDEDTPVRSTALQMLFGSIEQGFLSLPLNLATNREWDDACLALAELTCTLVTESIDELVCQSAEPILSLLLQLQGHPSIKIRINTLEVWLTVEEIPLGERHVNWRVTLFRHVMQGLMGSVAYAQDFTNWEESIDDNSEFDEYRRLCQDVFSSSYSLLRHEYVASHVNAAMNKQSHWSILEASIFALVSVARDIRARLMGPTGPSSVVTEREDTTHQLLSLVRSFCLQENAVNYLASRHTQLLRTVIEFIGAYATIWQYACPIHEVIGLLLFSQTSLSSGSSYALPAAKTIRSLLITMDSFPFLSSNDQQSGRIMMLEMLRNLMSAASSDAEALVIVTEGCTRFVAKSKDGTFVCEGLGQMAESVLNHASVIMQSFPSGQHATAYNCLEVERLVSFMKSLEVIIRFGDNGDSDVTKNEMKEVVQLILPFLQSVTPLYDLEVVLENGLMLHEKLLGNFPDSMSKHLDGTFLHVLDLFRAAAHPSALVYFTKAVELYGQSRVDLFERLFSNLSIMVLSRITIKEQLHESNELVKAFFELADRYVLYCPSGLLASSVLPSVVSIAVQCLSAMEGEKETTRSTLNFLAKLFGWPSLRLSPKSRSCLFEATKQLDELLMINGALLTQACFAILLGGPQMLYPACSDTLFAILKCSSTWQESDGSQSMVAQQWIHSAIDKELSSPDFGDIISVLLQLTSQNNKPQAKLLLTDLGKIHRGELGLESLVSFRNTASGRAYS